MNSIVTGASGFIGRHLVKALERNGHKVYHISHTDLHDYAYAKQAITNFKPDYIFHLAAYGNLASHIDEHEIVEGNYALSYRLLDIIKDLPIKAGILLSSSSVLLEKETLYSATKAGVERLVKYYSQAYNKQLITVRPYSVYGAYEPKEHFIPTVFRSCLEGEGMKLAPDPVHDWLYVDDLIDCIITAAKYPAHFKGQIINCGTTKGTTNQDIVKEIERITGKKAHITKHMKPRAYDTDNWTATVFRDNLYKANTSLADGLQKMYTLIQEGGE